MTMNGVRAAIYARKSTDQSGLTDEAKSVARQVERAREYASKRGWAVDDRHIYVDDNISGAEFTKRIGLQRLLGALSGTLPFTILIMSEESRLGRESIETSYTLKQLIKAGVRVFSYLNDRELVLNTAMDKAMLALQSMADEMERERARQRTYDALERKARQGFVTGGRVFGYDNVEVKTGGKRSHVERRINEDEAQVIRRVFELYAGGVGFKRIAVRLNDEGARCPRPQRGRPAGWSPSSIREVLRRPIYAGRAVWNTTRKRNGWGQVHQMPRPESEWLAVEVDTLRIIPDSLWAAVQERLAAAAKRSGKRGGRPPASGGKYLLTGLLQCGRCGAGMEVVSSKNGTTRKFRYGCSAYHRKGRAICGNSLVMDVQRIDLAMVDALESMLLREQSWSMQSSRQSVRFRGTPRRTTSSDLRAESPALSKR